jgi:hypothetical protein
MISKWLEVTDVILVAKQVPHLIDITQLRVKLPPAQPGAYWVSASKAPIKP